MMFFLLSFIHSTPECSLRIYGGPLINTVQAHETISQQYLQEAMTALEDIYTQENVDQEILEKIENEIKENNESDTSEGFFYNQIKKIELSEQSNSRKRALLVLVDYVLNHLPSE